MTNLFVGRLERFLAGTPTESDRRWAETVMRAEKLHVEPATLAENEVAILQLPMPVNAIVAVTQALQLAYGDDLDILTWHGHGPDVMVIARGKP